MLILADFQVNIACLLAYFHITRNYAEGAVAWDPPVLLARVVGLVRTWLRVDFSQQSN